MFSRFPSIGLVCLFALCVACTRQETTTTAPVSEPDSTNVNETVASEIPKTITSEIPDTMTESTTEKATFGGGCYWCTEAVFQRLKGVDGIVSGFMGGQVEDPSYEAVCSGTTGHAECIQFNYDPSVIAFKDLLEVFWKTHDPTTLNRQGADVGTQYRSVVFFHSDEQKEIAEKYKQKLNDENAFGKPVVTEISEASKFYAALAKHQNYYNDNPGQGYCSFVIRPKVDKVEKVFADKLK